MRNYLIMLVMAASTLVTFSSCDDDEDNPINNGPSRAQVEQVMQGGDWRVTNFSEAGTNHTDYFTNYDFTFGLSNVLTATNGTDTQVGIWSVDDDDDDDDVDFNIIFAGAGNFSELTEDWDIVELTTTKIRLRNVNDGGGGTDLLTFEKN